MSNSSDRFEEIDIPGIGNLKAFASMSIHDVRRQVDPARFALYVVLDKTPDGWPPEIMQDVDCTTMDGKPFKATDWHMNLDGLEWKCFYGFVIETYIEKLKTLYGFIYERRVEDQRSIYFPRVSILAELDGTITSASEQWCRTVMKHNHGL